MLEIEFKPEELIGNIKKLQEVQIPRASQVALTQAAYTASQELKSQARSIFNNPVPFTISAFLYEKPKKTGDYLQARIYIREDAAKGNPPAKYLAPQLIGRQFSGGRHYPTRFQGALLDTVVQMAGGRSVQVGQRGKIMIPNLRSPKTRLTQFGNMRPGQYNQILTALRGNISSADIYGQANRGEAPVNDQSLAKYIYLDEEEIAQPYFRRRLTNSPKPGIYFVNRLKGGTKYYRVMTESRLPTYTGKFPFLDIAERTAIAKFNEIFSSMVLR